MLQNPSCDADAFEDQEIHETPLIRETTREAQGPGVVSKTSLVQNINSVMGVSRKNNK